MDTVIKLLVDEYGFPAEGLLITPLGNGLINHTWKITSSKGDFVFQQINTTVFKNPEAIDENLRLISRYLQEHYPDYLLAVPVATITGRTLLRTNNDEYFRLLPFVPDSHSVDVVETPEQAYKAAALFGGFTKRLAGLSADKLKTTLPHFHNLSLRFQQFQEAIKNGNPERIKESATLIKAATDNAGIVSIYEKLQENNVLRMRATHHDTKISNVLFDSGGKGLCVIDLDTVMPGYFISDTGDMLRTMLSPVSEEETDTTKLEVRDEFYRAIRTGYMDAMKEELSKEEQGLFFYSGCFMLYMQGLRFLTDYLNNDVYYGATYPGHNFNRAHNQFILLRLLQEKESMFK